jgi:hypothetical protein
MMSMIAVIPGRILNQLTSPLKSVGERVGQQLLEEYGLFCSFLMNLMNEFFQYPITFLHSL